MKIYKNILLFFIVLILPNVIFGQIENTSFYKELFPENIIPNRPNLQSYENDIVSSFILDSKRYYLRDDYESAFSTLQNALKIDSTCAVCYFEQANLFNYQEYSLIIPLLVQAIRYDHKNIDYLSYLYRILYVNELSSNIAKLLEYTYHLDIENTFFLEQYYNFNLAINNYNKALDALNKIEAITGSNSLIIYSKSELYVKLKQKRKALKLLKSQLKSNPSNYEYHSFLGSYYSRYTKNYSKAEQYFKSALILEQHDSQSQLGMLNISTLKNKIEDERYYIKEIIINPTLDINDKFNFLRFLYPATDFYFDKFQTVDILKTAVTLDSKNSDLISNYITSNIEDIDHDLVKDLSLFTLNYVNDENLWIQLIVSSDEKYDDYTETLKLINSGLSVFPESSRLNYLKGFYYYVNQNLDEAKIYLNKSANNLDKDNNSLNSFIFSLLGEIYYKNNDFQKAFSFFDKSLLYDNTNLITMNNYAYYLSLQKSNLDKAESLISLVINNEPNNPIYLDTYAWVMFAKEKFLDALFIIEQINFNDLDQSIYFEHYADILFHNGEYEKAFKNWEKAVELLDEENPTLLKKVQDKTYYETLE